jgi:hypothetical protein
VHWCSLAHDLQAARADGIGPARWLAWALRCEVKSGFAWNDPLPLPRAALARLRRRVAGPSALGRVRARARSAAG